jgi:autotransporter-associated beta strand protein
MGKRLMRFRRTLELTHLESRLAPALATWDGGGANNLWSTPQNWVGDVAPNPGDDLVFPEGTLRSFTANDFAPGTSFGQIRLTGVSYQISGNAITLSNGIAANIPIINGSNLNPVLSVDLTLAAPQSFTVDAASIGVVLSGAINLNGNNLTATTGLTISGPISGAGSLTVTGNSDLFLTGSNTFTGPTNILGGNILFNGSQTGSVNATGGLVTGAGSIGALEVSNGAGLHPFNGQPNLTPPAFQLTTGNLAIDPATGSAPAGSLTVRVLGVGSAGLPADRIVVHGSVRLGGQLVVHDSGYHIVFPLNLGTVVIIDNDGSDPVQGTFAGLPEGAIIRNVTNKVARISYHGGDGNDVTLTILDEAYPSHAVGVGAGGLPLVNTYFNDGVLAQSFFAYDTSFRGGVRVAVGDVVGGDFPEIVTAPGPGGPPLIRVFDGHSGALIEQFLAYDARFTGGVFLAIGDTNGNGQREIITGAGPGGGPHVRVFENERVIREFMAYDVNFRGGVTVAAGFVTPDNQSEIITGAGQGGGPHVKVFNGFTGALISQFMAYETTFTGGIYVAAADINLDGIAEVVTGTGVGGGPLVRVFNSTSGSRMANFFAYDPNFRGGVTVAAQPIISPFNAIAILTGPGPGGGPHVELWTLANNTATLARSFFAFDPAFLGGVFVG